MIYYILTLFLLAIGLSIAKENHFRVRRQAFQDDNLDCSNGQGFYLHPKDCRFYYRCWVHQDGRYQKFVFACPSFTVFDLQEKTCKLASLAAPCSLQEQRGIFNTQRPTPYHNYKPTSKSSIDYSNNYGNSNPSTDNTQKSTYNNNPSTINMQKPTSYKGNSLGPYRTTSSSNNNGNHNNYKTTESPINPFSNEPDYIYDDYYSTKNDIKNNNDYLSTTPRYKNNNNDDDDDYLSSTPRNSNNNDDDDDGKYTNKNTNNGDGQQPDETNNKQTYNPYIKNNYSTKKPNEKEHLTQQPTNYQPTPRQGKCPSDKLLTDDVPCKGQGFFRNPLDCTQFYQCVTNSEGEIEKYLFDCPCGLVFQENGIKQCTDSKNVPECSKEMNEKPYEPQLRIY